ncbi:hypothetical protein ABPG72_020862, partial [Tetrahymena utriculariae]
MLCIQTLEGFNSLNSHNILHREIKSQNFLTSQKGDIGFAFFVNQSQSYDKSIKSTQAYFGPENEKRFSRILQLDNLITFYVYWIQQNIKEMYLGKEILTKFKDQINRKLKIFQIVEICLHPKYEQRISTTDFIQFLMNKQKIKPGCKVYSAILPDMVKKQAKIISQYNQKKQENESIPLEKNQLIELLFNNNESFEIIFTGSYGIILETKNVKRVKDTVLKISLVEVKTKIESEVEIMIIQIYLIVEFYSCQFIKGQNNRTHAVYEFDRFSCQLKQYLQRQKINSETSQDDKLQIFGQNIGCASYLHSLNAIYKDLMPDKFLILIKDNLIAIKLCDFRFSFYLNGSQPLITEKPIGTLKFYTSGKEINDKNKINSKK